MGRFPAVCLLIRLIDDALARFLHPRDSNGLGIPPETCLSGRAPRSWSIGSPTARQRHWTGAFPEPGMITSSCIDSKQQLVLVLILALDRHYAAVEGWPRCNTMDALNVYWVKPFSSVQTREVISILPFSVSFQSCDHPYVHVVSPPCLLLRVPSDQCQSNAIASRLC